MSEIQYRVAKNVKDAVALMAGAKGQGYILAGGTDLIVQMETGRASPAPSSTSRRSPRWWRSPRRTAASRSARRRPRAAIGEHEALRKAWPGVVEAANLIGSTQVQGRASIGGNLCNASPAADSVPALIAAGAICRDRRPERHSARCRSSRFSVGPGQDLAAAGRVHRSRSCLPPARQRVGDAYLRLIPRTEMDIAVVGAGVSLTLDGGGTCTAARVALGAVAPTVLLVAEAGDGADRHQARRRGARRARRQAASAACKPIDDKRGTIEYRIKIAGVLARARSRAIAYERAEDTLHEQDITSPRPSTATPTEFLSEPQTDPARRAARRAGPDRHQGRLRHRRLRRLHRDDRRPAGLLVPGAGGRGRGPADRDHRGHGRRRASCIRCSRSSSSRPRCSAASARRASWSPPRRCSTATRTRPRPRSATGWPATSAAAPATTRSSAR